MEMVQNYKLLKPGLDLLKSADTRAARINSIPVTLNTTREHWRAIVLITEQFVLDGHYVINEARFQNGGRADIYIPAQKLVIEVLHSESLEEYEAKCNRYYKGNGVTTTWVTSAEVLSLQVATIMKLVFSRCVVRS